MNRVCLINPITHTESWVTENRVEEYKGLGYSEPLIDSVPIVVEKKEAEAVEPKKTTKKTTKAKK